MPQNERSNSTREKFLSQVDFFGGPATVSFKESHKQAESTVLDKKLTYYANFCG